MGRSVAVFFMPPGSIPALLGTVVAFAQTEAFSVAQGTFNYVRITRGSALWTGERNITVLANETPAGVQVVMEAWIEGMMDLSANPNTVFGAWPRRRLWRQVEALCQRLGVAQPSAIFRHT